MIPSDHRNDSWPKRAKTTTTTTIAEQCTWQLNISRSDEDWTGTDRDGRGVVRLDWTIWRWVKIEALWDQRLKCPCLVFICINHLIVVSDFDLYVHISWPISMLKMLKQWKSRLICLKWCYSSCEIYAGLVNFVLFVLNGSFSHSWRKKWQRVCFLHGLIPLILAWLCPQSFGLLLHVTSCSPCFGCFCTTLCANNLKTSKVPMVCGWFPTVQQIFSAESPGWTEP